MGLKLICRFVVKLREFNVLQMFKNYSKLNRDYIHEMHFLNVASPQLITICNIGFFLTL